MTRPNAVPEALGARRSRLGSGDTERLAVAWDTLLLTLGAPRPSPERGCETRTPSIPVTVLSGFLGAGKTTLLQRLITESGSLRILAIVNDIGSVNVDAALVRSTGAQTIDLTNGCGCCVLGSDLRDTLRDILASRGPPDAIVIEASGLADPIGIAHTVSAVDGLILDGIVTVVDGQMIRERLADEFTAPIYRRQLAGAHIVVLTKTEQVPRQDQVALRHWVGSKAPGRPVLLTARGEAEAEVLLGAAARGARPEPMVVAHEYDGFAAETIVLPSVVCAKKFYDLLETLPDSLYRLKGWLELDEPSRPGSEQGTVEVQAVGTRWRTRPRDAGVEESQTGVRSPCSDPGSGGRLVAVGRRNDRAFGEFLEALRRLAC